jgi:hypothetical protein
MEDIKTRRIKTKRIFFLYSSLSLSLSLSHCPMISSYGWISDVSTGNENTHDPHIVRTVADLIPLALHVVDLDVDLDLDLFQRYEMLDSIQKE